MAFDIMRGEYVARDWSIGGGGRGLRVSGIGAGGTSRRSLALKEEVRTKTQAMALFELVKGEIKNNAVFASMRAKAGNLNPAEDAEVRKFFIAWHNWSVRNMEDVDRPPTAKTVDELNQWRHENAKWTTRLTAVSTPDVDASEKRAVARLAIMEQQKKASDEGSKWPLFAGLAALLGLGALAVGGKGRS
jgi:hypothetical protein